MAPPSTMAATQQTSRRRTRRHSSSSSTRPRIMRRHLLPTSTPAWACRCRLQRQQPLQCFTCSSSAGAPARDEAAQRSSLSSKNCGAAANSLHCELLCNLWGGAHYLCTRPDCKFAAAVNLRSWEDHRVRLRCRGLNMRHQGRSMRRQVPSSPQATSQVLWMILPIANLLANV